MVHLTFDFNELEAKNNWNNENGLHAERNLDSIPEGKKPLREVR